MYNSKRISLSDGTLILLNPDSKIVVSSNFNKSDRIVRMYTGHASFEVGPRTDKPFTVQMGTTQITDIGTIFTITESKDKITAEVTRGKVLFSKLSSSDFKELNAGNSVTFDIQKEQFGEVTTSDTATNYKNTSLDFENTALSDVVVTLQKRYKKKIILQDQTLAGKMITAKLGGISYNTNMEVLCKSLDLEFSIQDSVYLLKNKTR